MRWPFYVSFVILVGVTAAIAPAAGWLMLAALATVTMLQLPVYRWVGAAVLLVVFSRLIVSIGFGPEILNFVHFPLVVGAAVAATVKPSGATIQNTWLMGGICVLLVVSVASWLVNGGELVRPLLVWMVFAEPFLIVYALLRSRVHPVQVRWLWKVLIVAGVAQLPLALWQAASHGRGDPVAGTFVGQGVGAHAAGAVALLGALVLLARATAGGGLRNLAGSGSLGLILLLVPFLADAKQSLAAFLAGSVFLVWKAGVFRRGKVLVLGAALTAVILLGAASFERFREIINIPLILRGVQGKLGALGTVARAASGANVVFGAGPGNSVSRVGLMALESYAKPNSPVRILGLRPAPATERVILMTQSNWLFASSSAWSGISSWLGIFGDLGLAGSLVYLWLGAYLWSALGPARTWESHSARAALIMAALLGGVHSWLEEPGFAMVVALLVGLGIISARRNDSITQRPGRP